jgi:hypothetical protein
MEFIIIMIALIQSIAISLGVGSSTLAVINFFVAIADGKIDETERKMMGVVYVILRIAMVTIAVTTTLIIGHNILQGGISTLTPFYSAQITLICILFINAILMTMRIMPSTFGPAIQAGSWYLLGILAALVPLGYVQFSYGQFLLGYVAILTLATAVINGMMALLKEIKNRNAQK